MKLLKFGLATMLLLICASVLFAGGDQESKGPVTVTFMVHEADLPKDFVDSFNADNPMVNLIRVEANWEKWMADAMAGTAADLMQVNGDQTAYFTHRGLWLDMTDMMDKSEMIQWDDIDPLGNLHYQYDGTVYGKGPWYGLTKDYNNIGAITYNREMFKDAGIADLSTTKRITYQDEFYDLAKKLTQKDSSGNVIIFGTEFAGNWATFWSSDMAYAEGTTFWSDDSASKMNNDSKMRNIWKYWAKFKVDDIASNIRNPASGWTGAMFQSDRVAMVQLGYWFGAQMMSNEGYNEKYGWAPTPILRKGSKPYTNTLGATGTAIYAKTKYPEAAFRVFEWYNAGAYGLERAETGWGIPPLYSLHKYLPKNNKFNKDRLDIALEDAKYFVPFLGGLTPFANPGTLFVGAWNAYIDDLVEGKINYDTFVDKFYADLDDTLAAGKEELGM